MLVEVYNLLIQEGKYHPIGKMIPLTDEDRSRGSINALEVVGTSYDYAKVTFDTPYGQALWRSENTQFWVPVQS